MREMMLIMHVIGVSMAVGASFALMFINISGGKVSSDKIESYVAQAFKLSKMGNIGLGLLILSGGYLLTPYWQVLASMPLLVSKLLLVLVLGAFFGIIGANASKARKGVSQLYIKKIDLFGKLSMITALSIVILAVLIFH